MLDPEILQKIIERDQPEMNVILEEFQKSMEMINTKLKPVIERVRQTINQEGENPIETKHGMSYLEMKYNLMLSYCSFLTYYLLLKLEGAQVENHPVIGKLVHIKTLFEKLRPLDAKLQYQVDKMLKQAALDETQEVKVLGKRDNLQYRPNVDMLAEEAEQSEESDEEAQDDEFQYGGEEDSEIEEDISKPLKKPSKKKVVHSDSSDSEKPNKKGVYKANKMNPIMYKDTVDKASKKIQREETHQKHKLNKSNYIQMLKEEMDQKPEEVVGAIGMGKKTAYMKEMEMLEKVEN